MPVSHEEVMSRLSSERQERIRSRAQELLAQEEMTLRDLRAIQHLTQSHLADALGIEQDSVSRMERRSDMLVSTVADYVEAMGGTLHLIAEFPNRRPYTVRLADRSETTGSRRRRRKPGSPGSKR
jgi:DNA-binding XRE family transcriptional regulator